MNQKHYQKEFEVVGVKLKLKKLGLADFPSFKTIYARAIDQGDAEGVTKAYFMLFGWLEYELLGEWIPVFNKTKGEFAIEVLNDLAVADQIVNILLADILAPLFLSTAE
jgi:hypothetical protein